MLCLLLVMQAAIAEDSAGPSGLMMLPGAELVEQQRDDSPGVYLLALGSLEKVDHVLEPEDARTLVARRHALTWYLPTARRTADVAAFLTAQFPALGEVLFECRGRGCGSSSYWANRLFEQAILYGPEEYQHYFALTLADGSGYLAVYVAQRAPPKICVHIEQFLTDQPAER